MRIGLQIYWLVILVVSSMILSEEITSGTAKLILVRNVKRRDLIVGKFLALVTLSSTFLFFLHGIGLLLGYFLGGLSAVKEGEYLLFSAADLLRCYGWGMALTIPPMISLIAFGMLASTAVRGSGGAVGMAVVGYFLLQILSQVKALHKIIFIRYLFLPVDNMSRLIDGIYVDWSRHFQWNLAASTITVLLLIGSAVIIFQRKDLWS